MKSNDCNCIISYDDEKKYLNFSIYVDIRGKTYEFKLKPIKHLTKNQFKVIMNYLIK